MPEEEFAKAELIDDWLQSHKGMKGVECYTHSLTVYFPVASRHAEDEFEKLLATCNEIFKGSTVYDAEGSWCAKSPCGPENVVREPVKVIEMAHHCVDAEQAKRFAEALKEAAISTKQEAVSIAGTGKFLIIPPGKFKEISS